jgi:AcrR family transcriptional regulator
MISTETETYQKIIESAEEIFAVKGYDGASIREITASAGVNLAAIHYHFGSKEKLLQVVLNRKLEWLNKRRLKALTALEKNSEFKPLKPSQILEAFFGTLLDMLDEKDYGGEMFLRLLARSSLEPGCLISSISHGQNNIVVEKFRDALYLALPNVPKSEIVWRFQFMVGATSYAISGDGLNKLFATAEVKESVSTSKKLLKQRLISFLLGGLRTPINSYQRQS